VFLCAYVPNIYFSNITPKFTYINAVSDAAVAAALMRASELQRIGTRVGTRYCAGNYWLSRDVRTAADPAVGTARRHVQHGRWVRRVAVCVRIAILAAR